MTWSAGTYTRPGGATAWGDDRDAAVEITAALHDTHDEDIANAINSCLEKSGSNSMTGDLNFGTNKGTNCVDPTAAQDVATKNYVDTNPIGVATSGDQFLARLGTTPTGWAIKAVNDYALRIVSSSAGTGGSTGFAAALVNAFTSGTESVSLDHYHTASGTLAVGATSHSYLIDAGSTQSVVIGANHNHTITGNTSTVAGGVTNHTHTVTNGVLYHDMYIYEKS